MKAVNENPHDYLSEKALLSCLLQESSAFNEIQELHLKKEDFYHPQYGLIFEIIENLISKDLPVDYITVNEKLTQMGKIETLGEGEVRGSAFLTSIFEDQATTAHIYQYAKTVKEKSTVRKVINVSSNIIKNAKSFTGSLRDYLSEVETSIFKVTMSANTHGMTRLDQSLLDNLKELEDRKNLRPGEITGLSTGLRDLDRNLLGMQSGQVIIVAARPAMGKTILGLNFAVNAAKKSKLPVAFFSLEMLASELSMRVLASEASVSMKALKMKNYTEEDMHNMGHAVQTLSQLPIYIDDNADNTLLDMQGHCRKLKAEQGLGLVVVDYLQLMRPHIQNPSREQQISEISRGLKRMAKELECPVLALSQLNRSAETRIDKRPILADLRESGSIEQDADIVLFIYRDEVYNKDTPHPGMAEIITGKNRSGETGTTSVSFVGKYMKFSDLDESFRPPQDMN